MNLNITGHHVEVTPADPRLRHCPSSSASRHFDQVIDVNVMLSVEKLQQKAEVTCTCSGKDIHVESDDADMYAAIDLLADKLDRQIVKHKEKAYAHPHDALKRQAAARVTRASELR